MRDPRKARHDHAQGYPARPPHSRRAFLNSVHSELNPVSVGQALAAALPVHLYKTDYEQTARCRSEASPTNLEGYAENVFAIPILVAVQVSVSILESEQLD